MHAICTLLSVVLLLDRCTHRSHFSSGGRVIRLNAEGYMSKELKILVAALLLDGNASQWCFTEVNRLAD